MVLWNISSNKRNKLIKGQWDSGALAWIKKEEQKNIEAGFLAVSSIWNLILSSSTIDKELENF